MHDVCVTMYLYNLNNLLSYIFPRVPIHKSETQNRELRDSVLQVLNQYVMNHFTDIIGNVLNMELQRQLLPRVNAKMDQLQNQMQLEIVQKLNVFDKTVKENIAQVCKSKVSRNINGVSSIAITIF